jgi:NAD(P)-dependent dehydrogenase (short-subunit alcohol dehydrogenase family)
MTISYSPANEDDVKGLEGKLALITGGSSGIGLATAKLFLRKGVEAVVVADLQSPPEDLGSRALYVRTDVTSWEDLRALFQTAIDRYGRIDIVFANAGIVDTSNYVDLREENVQLLEPSRRSLDVNIFGCLNTVALAIHHMQRQKPAGGSIVMTSSGAGYLGVKSAAYSMLIHPFLCCHSQLIATQVPGNTV